MDVQVVEPEHLRLLERGHAAGRGEHEDADVVAAAHRVLGRGAGVARGCAQDGERLAAAGQLVLEELAEQLHRHVLERGGRALGEVRDGELLVELGHRHDVRVGELGSAVGLGGEFLDHRWRDVVHEQLHNLGRKGCVPLGGEEVTPGVEKRRLQARIRGRHEQTAVGAQSPKQDVGELVR